MIEKNTISRSYGALQRFRDMAHLHKIMGKLLFEYVAADVKLNRKGGDYRDFSRENSSGFI